MISAPEWIADIDALEFTAPGGGRCFVHRLAFRNLLGKLSAPDKCLLYFTENETISCAAALARHRTLTVDGRAAKISILLENYFPQEYLEAQIAAFVTRYNHFQYRESLDNLKPAEIYFGRTQSDLDQTATELKIPVF